MRKVETFKHVRTMLEDDLRDRGPEFIPDGKFIARFTRRALRVRGVHLGTVTRVVQAAQVYGKLPTNIPTPKTAITVK